jgi:tRNA(Ile)-lysidine synthase
VSLQSEILNLLKAKKNLLAFSGGRDSSALFHLLRHYDIPFDIIHVNYNTRVQSQEEYAYALSLCRQYNKAFFYKSVTLESSNFEHQARRIRYAFFHETIAEYHYDNLITAHQLNDRFEWFLMQLCKGAGLYELLGMSSVEQREGYMLIRPMLHLDSQNIEHYLHTHQIQYYIDESNTDEKYRRNYFREHFAAALMRENTRAIAKSFKYLEEDFETLFEPCNVLHVNELSYFKLPLNRRSALITIDTLLKQRGYVMRQAEKEALKQNNTLVIARRFIVTLASSYCFIAPYRKAVMPKLFKEQCRKLKIEPKLRGYLLNDLESFERVISLLQG